MQIGTPRSLSLPLPTSSPARQVTPMQEAPPPEDELLQGATLPCSPWWEASLLNIATLVELTEGHRKMMDALRCLDDYGLQFICESVQALSREQTPVRAPPGYFMLQAPGALLAHELYRAASNLGTSIVAPLPASIQQPPAEAPIHHPDPEIEAVVINIECHEQASRDTHNNPR